MKPFDMCRKNGGKIRNVKDSKGVSCPVCTINGKSYRGMPSAKSTEGAEKSFVAAAINRSKK